MLKKSPFNTIPEKHKRLLICVLLAAMILALYWPVRSYEFVTYDDNLYVYDNPHVTGGLTLESVKWAFTDAHAHMWHPLTSISHILDCELFGPNPAGHHVTNLLLHIANALLLFTILIKMTGSFWKPAFVAALFALHPLQVESVAWIAERKNLLVGFFWLLTIAAYFHYAKKTTVGRYLLLCAAFIMALMAKPVAVTLPFVLLLLDYWPLNRLQLPAEKKTKDKSASARLLLEKTPLLLLSAVVCIITFIAQRQGGTVAATETITVKIRVLNTAVSYIAYIKKMFWPANLAVLYPHPGSSISILKAVACMLLLVALSALFLYFGRRKKYLAFGWLWYLGTLIPVIGLVQAGAQSMADRYTYLPALGIFIMLTWGFDELAARWNYQKPAFAIAAVIILIALTAVTRIHLSYWKNSFTLYSHALAVTKNNYITHYNLGVVYTQQGRYQEAIASFNEALKIDPEYTEAYIYLGNIYSRLGRFSEAIESHKQAVKIKPDYAEAHYNLGNAYLKLDRYPEAAQSYKQAIKIRPDYVEAYNNLGNVLLALGRYQEAIESFKKTIEINPAHTTAYYNLGNVYLNLGRYNEAAESYKQAIRINPGLSEAHINLGNAYFSLGRYSEAIESFRRTIAIQPNHIQAHYNLGVAYLTAGDSNSAVKQYEILKSLDPRQADNLLNLINSPKTLP